MRKNISEKMHDDRKAEFDIKGLENKSLFTFQPTRTGTILNPIKKRPEIRKGVPNKFIKQGGYSRPKQKNMYDVMET